MSLIHHPTNDNVFDRLHQAVALLVVAGEGCGSLLTEYTGNDQHALGLYTAVSLVEDLVEEAQEKWREDRDRPALPFEEAVRRVRFAPPGTDMGYRNLEDAALLLRVREKTRFPDVLCDLLDRFLAGQIDREKVVARLGQIEKGIEEGRPFEMPRGAGINIDVIDGKPWPKKKELPKPAVRGRPRPATSGTATSGRRR